MNLSKCLYVFNHVISKGRKEEGVYYFADLTAWYDVDGYNCYIGFKDLVMNVSFHSQYHCDYTEPKTLREFMLVVENMTLKKAVS